MWWDFIVITLIMLDQTFGVTNLAALCIHVSMVVGAFIITYIAVNLITHTIEP